MKITQEEYDKVIASIEKNTCFRFVAGVSDNSAIMVPVADDGKTPLGTAQHFSWKQLKALSKLHRPQRG